MSAFQCWRRPRCNLRLLRHMLSNVCLVLPEQASWALSEVSKPREEEPALEKLTVVEVSTKPEPEAHLLPYPPPR